MCHGRVITQGHLEETSPSNEVFLFLSLLPRRLFLDVGLITGEREVEMEQLETSFNIIHILLAAAAQE